MNTSDKSSASASTASRKANPDTSEKPYHLTPSEIKSLRRESKEAGQEMMERFKDFRR